MKKREGGGEGKEKLRGKGEKRKKEEKEEKTYSSVYSADQIT
jgi:hypothetical protein